MATYVEFLSRWIAAARIVIVASAGSAAAITVDELPAESVYTVAGIRIEGEQTIAREPLHKWIASEKCEPPRAQGAEPDRVSV